MNAAARRHIVLPRGLAPTDPFVERTLGQRATVHQAAGQIRILRSTEFGRMLMGNDRPWIIVHASVAHKLPA